MRTATLALLAMVSGCVVINDNQGTGGNGADLAVPSTAPDLGLPPDLAGAGVGDGGAACMPAGGLQHAQYVWNAIYVPMTNHDYAFDLNGDGRADNQLGNIEGALAGQNLDDQPAATQAVQSGQSISLVDEHADDLANDACAQTDLLSGTPTSSPDFSGSGHFTPDGSQPGHFAGPVVASRFTSEPSPAMATVASIAHVRLPLLGAVTAVDVVGARITYVRGSDGKLMMGQLNGAIRNQDVQMKLMPNIATTLTAKVQADPSSSSSMQILSIFDNGGRSDASCAAGTCQNPDGSCAVKGDGKIDTCEVSTSSLIANILAPDVQMFDAAGNYHPNPANTHKDSLSVGLGFTAVPATF